MFMGEYRHNIDAKGRMIIPARFRDELGNRFVVTRGLDGCLRTYTMAQWDAVFEQLKRLPSTKRETRMYIHGMRIGQPGTNSAARRFDHRVRN